MNARIGAVLFPFLIFSSAQAYASRPCSTLDKAIDSGNNVVILFVTNEETDKFANSQDDGEVEFYSDWYFYLGSFLKDQGDNVIVCRLSLAEGWQRFQSKKIPKDEWSIAFVKKGRPALYSAKPIVEPEMFKFASSYFDGKEDKKDSKSLGFSYVALRGN